MTENQDPLDVNPADVNPPDGNSPDVSPPDVNPLDIDPTDHDESVLDELGLPDSGKPAQSMPEVFDRLVDSVEEFERETQDDQPTEESFATIKVDAASPDGNVAVSVEDYKLAGLRINEAWLVGTDVTEVEAAITQTVNEAMEQAQRRAVEQLQAMTTPVGELMGNLREIQADMHRAYIRDLERVTSPLRDL